MFGYSILVAQYLDEKRKPISDGYYFIRDNDCYVTKEKPNGKIIGIKELEDILYEGFRNILLNFINSKDNKDVYCLALYTSEHNDLLMYINNEASFQSSLDGYIKKYPEYKDMNKAKSLKMSLGDFSFKFDCVEGLDGQSLQIMKLFDSINYFINVDNQLFVKGIKDYSFYFDGAVFNNALYSLVEKVLNRLKVEFAKLNKTSKFVSYPSCGDDYIDYYLLIRRHCDGALFYELFDNMKKADDDFNEYIKTLDGVSVKTLFEVLSDECIKNTHRVHDIFSKTIRNEYAAVKILGERLTVKESIELLKDLMHQASIDNSSKEVNTKIFLIGCVLINQSCYYRIPTDDIKKMMDELSYESENLNDIICYLETTKADNK